MHRFVSFRFLSTTALFVTALGFATGFSVEATTPPQAASDDDAAPACEAFGCDYEFIKADGTGGIVTHPCSAACNCPAIVGHTVRHARCYLTADGDDDDEAPVEEG